MFRVLVADDDPEIRGEIADFLRSTGYPVIEAEDGGEALERLSGGGFDLAILDVVMPRINGIEAIIEVQQRVPATRIIAISGDGVGRGGALTIADKLGVRTLAKPFGPRELRQAVESCLETATPCAPAVFRQRGPSGHGG
jgi:CheY-like chemotaxis protein